MNTSLAFRYLLLRHLAVAGDDAAPAVHEEVAGSLEVMECKRHYRVEWNRGNRSFSRLVHKAERPFYTRADPASYDQWSLAPESDISSRSREIALAALGLDHWPGAREAGHSCRSARHVVSLVWYLLLCFLVALSQDWATWQMAGVLYLVLAAEFLPRVGNVLASLVIWCFILVNLPLVTIAMGLGFAGTQLFKAGGRTMWLCVLICVAASVSGVSSIEQSSYSWMTALACCTLTLLFAVPTAIIKWTQGTHYRTLPLVLPFVSGALVLEGKPSAAAIVGASVVVSIVAERFGYRYLPDQWGGRVA